jgi:hypothetical protein
VAFAGGGFVLEDSCAVHVLVVVMTKGLLVAMAEGLLLLLEDTSALVV